MKKRLTIHKLFFLLAVMVLIVGRLNPAVAQSGTATMNLSPGTSNITAGSAATINLMFNTQNLSATGFQVVADFTGSVPSNLAFSPIPPSGFSTSYNQLVNVTGGKRLQLIIDTGSTTGYSTNGNQVSLGTLTFTAPSSGTMTVVFDQAQTAILDSAYNDILGSVPGATYTYTPINPTPRPTPSATPQPSTTPRPSPNVTPQPSATPAVDEVIIFVQVKFEGVNQQRSEDRFVIATLKQGSSQVTSQNVRMRSDATGIFSNSVSDPTKLTNVVGPGTYDFFINGPVHLTRKYPGISIGLGTNTIDLTVPPLLAGDIRDNNITDESDYNRIVENFGCVTGQSPPPGKNCAPIDADLDLDGDVDIFDYAFLVGNYGLTGDQ